MILGPKKIDPLDLQPRKAIGVDIPFQSDSVFTQNFQTKDAIKNNLVNYLLTGRGERYLNPTFGSGLRDLLFEQITEDTLEELRTRIRSEIGFNFPRITVTDIKIEPLPDIHEVRATISYSINNTDVEDNILITIEQ
jgi:phage baseplate assembly protein W